MRLAIALLAVLAVDSMAQERKPLLNEDSYDKTHNSIVPGERELRWMEIGWRPTFWEAVVEAQREKKPVLLWAMNGHPLACT